jgi:hypothetical protein
MNMKTKACAIALLLVGLVAGAGGCIMEDKIIEVVVTNETCGEFEQNSASVNFSSVVIVDYASEIDQALADNDVSRGDIVTARIVSVSYGVTSFSQTHDWTVSGGVNVRRLDVSDGPAAVFEYTSVSVAGALDKSIPADLIADGVGVLNRALDAYVAGGNPVLQLVLSNGSVSPTPSQQNPIIFGWKTCVVTQIVTRKSLEVPDPF